MKTKINYFLITLFACACLTGTTFGQFKNKKSEKTTSFVYGDIFTNAASDGPASHISSQALSAFKKSFPGASDSRWNKVKKFYAVDFRKNGIKHKALYNVKGNMVYHISYGSEKNLPREIKNILKKEYPGFDITSAAEVNEGLRNVWIINLDDDVSLLTAGIESGVIEELSRYKKFK